MRRSSSMRPRSSLTRAKELEQWLDHGTVRGQLDLVHSRPAQHSTPPSQLGGNVLCIRSPHSSVARVDFKEFSRLGIAHARQPDTRKCLLGRIIQRNGDYVMPATQHLERVLIPFVL